MAVETMVSLPPPPTMMTAILSLITLAIALPYTADVAEWLDRRLE